MYGTSEQVNHKTINVERRVFTGIHILVSFFFVVVVAERIVRGIPSVRRVLRARIPSRFV